MFVDKYLKICIFGLFCLPEVFETPRLFLFVCLLDFLLFVIVCRFNLFMAYFLGAEDKHL